VPRSAAHRSESCRPCVMPITLARGWSPARRQSRYRPCRFAGEQGRGLPARLRSRTRCERAGGFGCRRSRGGLTLDPCGRARVRGGDAFSRRVGSQERVFRLPHVESQNDESRSKDHAVVLARHSLQQARAQPVERPPVKAGISIEQLAESIAQRTLLQSLNVRAVVDAEGGVIAPWNFW
jgi:hypothetical protein